MSAYQATLSLSHLSDCLDVEPAAVRVLEVVAASIREVFVLTDAVGAANCLLDDSLESCEVGVVSNYLAAIELGSPCDRKAEGVCCFEVGVVGTARHGGNVRPCPRLVDQGWTWT